MRLPAILKFLHHAAARLAEASVAQGSAMHEHLSPRGTDGLLHLLGRGAGDALIALAVVVGAHVKVHMVVAVPPLDEFLGGIHHLSLAVRMALS